MHFDPPSIRRAQLLAAVSALVLLVLLFALKWYGPGAITSSYQTSTVNGWQGLIHLRWLILVTVASAFALAALGVIAPRSRLQLPLSLILTLLALATLLWLGYRVLISIPPGEKPAAFAGLACALAIFLGGGISFAAISPAKRRRLF